jgi:hypothetical protein
VRDHLATILDEKDYVVPRNSSEEIRVLSEMLDAR